MPKQIAVSIVIPTLNEADNIMPLIIRIKEACDEAKLNYEVIFIDDHSTDSTKVNILAAQKLFPTAHVRYAAKIGERGKASSLQQGFKLTKHDIICMIDADLQYPPEAIAPMLQLLEVNDSDIIITERREQNINPVRKLSTNVFNYFFVNLLFGFEFDTQSGLKMFRKHILNTIELTPGKWSFDLEFIVRSLEDQYKILSYEIPFTKRHSGDAKINLVTSTYDLVSQSIKLRANSSRKTLRKAYQANAEFIKQADTDL